MATISQSAREGGAEAEPEVHRHADHQRDVGLAERGAAGARERQPVVGRHAAAGEPVEEDRDAAPLGQRLQRALAAPPVEVRAGHDHRPLGVLQQRQRAVQRRAGGLQRAWGAGRSELLGVGLGEDDVEREVEEHGAGVRPARDGERLVHQARDLGRRAGGGGELDQRPHERHVVDLLQRALAPAERGRAAAQHHDRRTVLLRGRHPAHPVGHARAGGQRGDTGLPRDLRPPLGGERRGGLVADVDELDPLVPAALVEREQMPSGEGEQAGDAVRSQALGDQATAVQPGRLVVHQAAQSIPPPGG